MMPINKTKCLSNIAPHLICELHPNKNGNFSPNDYISLRKKIWWKCPKAEDHIWQADIHSRADLWSGCPCCSGHKIVLSNCLQTTHPEIAKQWHPTKNGTLTPYAVGHGSCKKAYWQCLMSIDHVFKIRIAEKTKNKCPYCDGKSVILSNCLQTTHPEIAKQWHPTKNGTLTPKMVVSGSDKKIWWICSNRHEWRCNLYARTGTRKTGCPICSESKGEKEIATFLNSKNIYFERQKRFGSCRNKNCLPFDFSLNINDSKICIEYQGKQHYSPSAFGGRNPEKVFEAIRINDKIKEDWCKKENIKLIIIPFWEFGNIATYLENMLVLNNNDV